ncbi:MAG: alpha/beta hydrolase fold protein [Myxococcales bacterium]|nr:alpha/beta hydrolase fold protein [Myxococcales bacterium]
MDHELRRHEDAEPGRRSEPLERTVPAVVRAMCVLDPSAGEGRIDRALGISIERIGLGGERGILHRRDEVRPQRAGVADQEREAMAPGEVIPARLARGRDRIEGVNEVEARISELGDRVVHASDHGTLATVPARLHHERIAHSDRVPDRWLLLTHGIYGAGSNWRTIARKLTDRRPEWGVILLDLRQHGRSEGGASPHTLAACADDVRALVDELGGVTALAGHSFGGKVMLATRPLVHVEQTWMLDASPSLRPSYMSDRGNSVLDVLEMMERLPPTWAKRDDFVAAVVAEGHDLGLAQWLAMNIVPDPAGTLTMRLDLPAVRAMITDYAATDLWDSLLDPAPGRVEIVIAERASVFTPEDRARLAQVPPHVHVHTIDAGHWLHIQAPQPVVELFATELP